MTDNRLIRRGVVLTAAWGSQPLYILAELMVLAAVTAPYGLAAGMRTASDTAMCNTSVGQHLEVQEAE